MRIAAASPIQQIEVGSIPSPAIATKLCKQCSTVKPLTEFHKAGRGKLSHQCKPCKGAYERDRQKSGRRSYLSWLKRDGAYQERMTRLVDIVLDITGVSVSDLVKRMPDETILRARYMICWIAVRSRIAPSRIIRQHIQRDRNAVSRGVERMERMRELDNQLRAMTDDLRRQFQQ